MNALPQPLYGMQTRAESVDTLTVAQVPTFRAWCFSDSVIYMGHETPPGAIEIVRGPEQLVRGYLQTVADTSAIGTTAMVVPGMFEAADVRESYAILRRWLGWCATKDGSGLMEWNVTGRTTL